MKTQADYFKQTDIQNTDTTILVALYDILSPLCNYLVKTPDNTYGNQYKYNNEDFWKKQIDYKDLLKPILNKVGLKKGSDLRNKLKEYYKYGFYNKSLIINRIVSIVKKELAIRIVNMSNTNISGKKHKSNLLNK